MAGTFFVRVAGDVQGPYDTAKVRQLAVTGKIGVDGELSRDCQKWIPARNVKGLALTPAPAVSTLPTSGNGTGSASCRATLVDSTPTEPASQPVITGAIRSGGNVLTVDTPSPLRAQRSRPTVSFNLAACPDCGQLVSLRASDCPHCGGPIRRVPLPQPKPKYRMLRLISSAYAALGIIVTLVAAFAVAVLVYCIAQGDLTGATAAFLALVVCVTGGVTCFAASEAMQVFLQIEQNTRATRLAIAHRNLSDLG